MVDCLFWFLRVLGGGAEVLHIVVLAMTDGDSWCYLYVKNVVWVGGLKV